MDEAQTGETASAIDPTSSDFVKVARRLLKREGNSNLPNLPDYLKQLTKSRIKKTCFDLV